MKKSTGKKISLRPPIVTILGHVDHGKTTLLDKIRNTNTANKEYGGITQHTTAYQIEVNKKKITFIDTPGHEAFAKMRSRGAHIADIVILVVAGNDGVMPQTLESIEYFKAANIPSIVAINKIDLPDINLEKIKKQLTKAGLKLEEYGGEIPLIPLSAKTGQGINKLLEMILLLAELNQVKQDDPDSFQAVIIESAVSKTKGIVARAIVMSGKIEIKDEIVCENQEFRIRAIYDWEGKLKDQAEASDPIEILGWKKIPSVGSPIYNKQQLLLTQPTPTKMVKSSLTTKVIKQNIPQPLTQEKIKVILKTDTFGTP